MVSYFDIWIIFKPNILYFFYFFFFKSFLCVLSCKKNIMLYEKQIWFVSGFTNQTNKNYSKFNLISDGGYLMVRIFQAMHTNQMKWRNEKKMKNNK